MTKEPGSVTPDRTHRVRLIEIDTKGCEIPAAELLTNISHMYDQTTMHKIALNPYDTIKNPVSIKLVLAGIVLSIIALGPSVAVVVAEGVSIALVGSGLWLLVMGLLALYCCKLARRIPNGIRELRLENDSLICAFRSGEIAIPVSEIDMLAFDKTIADFIGFEIVLTHDVNVVQIAARASKHELEPIFEMLCQLLELNELPDHPLGRRSSGRVATREQ